MRGAGDASGNPVTGERVVHGFPNCFVLRAALRDPENLFRFDRNIAQRRSPPI